MCTAISFDSIENMYTHTHTTVCRDLELRVNNKGESHEEIVEVCINDEWYQATSAKVANTSQSSQDISVTIADSTSVMIKWSKRQSIPSSDKTSADMIYRVEHCHYLMGRSMKWEYRTLASNCQH